VARHSESPTGNGYLRVELPDGENPPFLTVSFAGFGTRIVALAKGRSDQTLPPIELGPCRNVARQVARKARFTVPGVETSRGDVARRLPRAAVVDGNGTQWKVDNLDAGEYRLLISGSQPLQHFGASVKIRTRGDDFRSARSKEAFFYMMGRYLKSKVDQVLRGKTGTATMSKLIQASFSLLQKML